MRTFTILAISLVLSIGSAAEKAGTVRVAVASNFAAAHDALAKKFAELHKHKVLSSPGSTGKLYTQIVNGAPFDVFLAADKEHVEELEKKKLTVESSRFTYAIGRIALFSPRMKEIDTVSGALSDANIKHLAIANPRTAPYGAAAVATMKKLGIWERFESRLVYGENIGQTMQFVDTGNAEAGFVAYSQVIDRDTAQYWLVPDSLHPPLEQDAVLIVHAAKNNAAVAYCAFLRSEDARKIIASFGYQTAKP